MLKYLANIIQLIFSPQKGWEDLEDSDFRSDGRPGAIDIRKLYTGCFLPLIAVCSLTAFVQLLYIPEPTFTKGLVKTIIEFASLFLSYHLAVYIFSWWMPRLVRHESNPDMRRHAIMVMYCISVVAIIFLIKNVIKVDLALIDFLPFYVMFIIWKGAEFVGIPERNIGGFMFMATAAILGTVYGLSFLFNILL